MTISLKKSLGAALAVLSLTASAAAAPAAIDTEAQLNVMAASGVKRARVKTGAVVKTVQSKCALSQ